MSMDRELFDWILERKIEDYTTESPKEDRIRISSPNLTAEVNFYDINNTIIVEERIVDNKTDEPTFFLHFELLDLDVAKKNFQDMEALLREGAHDTTRHVLLCCTCGMTTTFFSNKLNEKAELIGIRYDFRALPVTEAVEHGNDYVAILLAPQVGYAEAEIRAACPDAIIIPVPPTMYGAYDVGSVLELLIERVTNARHNAAENLRMARDIDNTKRVLAISWVHRNDEPTLAYQVLDKGEIKDSGMFVKEHFDRGVLTDLATMLAVKGYTPESFDAVGLAIPGEVDKGVVTTHDRSTVRNVDYGAILSTMFSGDVRVDNNACAAAAGCYITQDVYDSLCFHAQEIGKYACDQGYIIGGKPHAGYRGFAGNVWWMARNFSLSQPLDRVAWNITGSLELAAHYLMSTICMMAPEAIFVWADLVPDMEELHDQIAKELPEDVIPKLIAVPDYDKLTLVGELALCLQGLAANEKK